MNETYSRQIFSWLFTCSVIFSRFKYVPFYIFNRVTNNNLLPQCMFCMFSDCLKLMLDREDGKRAYEIGEPDLVYESMKP